MKLRDCDVDIDGASVLAIINDLITNTSWVYDYAPRTAEQFAEFVTLRRADGFPAIVAEDPSEQVLGFGTFGEFRQLPGYRYTVEHTVFVAKHARRRGVGSRLLRRLIELARMQDRHVLVGAIDSTNAPSVALHESLGFEHCGTLHEVGFKHGRWLDVLFYQYVLDTPRAPSDDHSVSSAGSQ